MGAFYACIKKKKILSIEVEKTAERVYVMRNIMLGAFAIGLITSTTAFAQNAFWGFDENNQETYIPVQCDGQFDETNGGVFMPTPEELFEQGEAFLLERGAEQSKAGYCLLSAAIQGNVKAQYRVAQLYNKGLVLPQNDIAAYRWAFLASLNGSKEAEQLALTLEQLLTAEEIQMATKTIEPMLPTLKQEKNADLQAQEAILAEKKTELEEINKEIDDLLGVDYKKPKIKTAEEIRAAAQAKLSETESEADEGGKTASASGSTKEVKATVVLKQQPTLRRRHRGSETKKAVSGEKQIFTEADRLK